MNVPNSLSLFRIFCTPVIVYILLAQFKGWEIVGFIVFFLAQLSDTVDGIWARRKKQTTVLGTFLDPVSDKVLVSSVLICFAGLDIVPTWMVVVLVCREIAVTGFRAIASSRNINIPSFFLGKFKITVISITIDILILGDGIVGELYFLAHLGLWVSLAAAVLSAAEIFAKYAKLALRENS